LNSDGSVPRRGEMKDLSDVENLERLIVQLRGLHNEIAQLAKKSANDALNKFKLRLVNKVIEDGNKILGKLYKPFEAFNKFDEDEMPTNSDVTLILSQYMEQAERYRSDNVIYHAHKWVYVLRDQPSDIEARRPTRVGRGDK
jgi:hypothetical protein